VQTVNDHHDEAQTKVRHHSRLKRVLVILLAIAALYALLAYLVLPAIWTHYEHQKGLANLPMVTRTAQGIPGDAINVGLIGNEKEVLCSMNAAGWLPADPVTFKSSIEIAGSVLLDRAYPDAPVSPLYYLGGREDFAFEKSSGKSADRRHHVRFWKVLDKGQENRSVWLGSDTFDKGVGVSHFTGAVTHHIDADIDAEREFLADNLEQAGMVTAKYQVTGVGLTLAGRNGGGDLYYTDGEVWILRLVDDCRKQTGQVTVIPSPPATQLKDQIWRSITQTLGR
jgi:LssY C-terminus